MEMISLASGATYFNTPEPARQAAIAAIQNNKTFYADVAGTRALREAIVQRYQQHNQARVDPDNILVTPGTKQALYNVLRAILKPGDEVVIPAPNWFGLHQVMEPLGVKLLLMPTSLADNYALRPGKLKELISPNTRLFIFSNPCNPTGRRYSPEEVEALLQVTRKHPDLYVLSDEVYDLVFYGERVPSLLEMDDPHQQHIVVNGFSKSFAMTGWRIGYVITPPSLREVCRQFQQATYSGVPEFVQEAAQVLVQHQATLLPPLLEILRENKMVMSHFLTARGILYYSPDGAYYTFPDLARYLTDALPTVTQLAAWLKERYGLEILPGDLFGAPGFARLSFGIEKERLQQALHRLGQALDALKGKSMAKNPEL
jgi:aspartate aminotransferase